MAKKQQPFYKNQMFLLFIALFSAIALGVPAAMWVSNNVVSTTAAAVQTTDGDGQIVAPADYLPFQLANVYVEVRDKLDVDATFGASDVYAKVFQEGEVDPTGDYLDSDLSDGNDASGTITFSGNVLMTNEDYDGLLYQGDGGTNLYAEEVEISIPALSPEVSSYTMTDKVFMYKEGAFTESAWDSATAAFDESSDVVTLNKTAETVQGCLEWDGTYKNSVSGSVLRDPVIVFEESSSDSLTDSEDVEFIYLSVKTGQGVSVPSRSLKTEFEQGIPISTTEDGLLGSSDSATLTLQLCLPAAEANVGTGSILMHFDDLGDYRARDLDNDVRAAAETTTFTITE